MKPFAAVFTALCLSACATVPADVLRPVTASLTRSDGGLGRISDPAALISQVSVARPNDAWFVDYGKTGDSAWCGTGGCRRELYVARGDGYPLVFDHEVLDWRLTQGATAVLDVELHRANCDAIGSEPCLRRFVWNDVTGRFDEAVNREGFGYLVGPLFQPIAPHFDDYPDIVTAEIERREMLCHTAGGLMDSGEFRAVSSPDLNGDGRRDWIIGSRYTACRGPSGDTHEMPDMGVSVIVSVGDRWTVALRAPTAAYAVDLAYQPARFGVRDERMCTGRPGCPTRMYVWHEDDQMLHDSGLSDWNPSPTPTAETWLECIVATERSSADAAEQFLLRNPGPAGEARRRDSLDHYSRMMALYRERMEASSPALTASEIAERRRVYEGRYDEPTELEPAQWRGDSCVAWL
ncbi:hypothetical protein [Brevundimonas sp.]|uniref:hypothetical protein n=1 Tax=Brevundimonas sp. TaxID=1871086 RepID=UPI003BA8F9D6